MKCEIAAGPSAVTVPHQRGRTERPCAGCLGTGVCWVCLGTGAHHTELGVGACRSCAGSTACRYCDAGPVRALAPRRRT